VAVKDERFLTVDETTRYLRVDPKTVYRLISGIQLKAAMVGRVYRIQKMDIQDFVRKSNIQVQQAGRKKY
jgi:excisionase family DNA binding protein